MVLPDSLAGKISRVPNPTQGSSLDPCVEKSIQVILVIPDPMTLKVPGFSIKTFINMSFEQGFQINGDSNLLFLSLGVCLKNTGVRKIRFYMVFNGAWSTVQHPLKLSSEGKLVILISHKVSLIRCNILQPTRAQPGHGVHGCS